MEVKIDIIDRVYDQMKEMCDFNKITVEKYVLDCVMDDFNIMKYGDLNEKINPKKEEEQQKETVEKPVVEEKKQEEKPKKKVGRPKKVKEEEKPKEKEIEKPLVETKETFFGPLEIVDVKGFVKKEETVDTTDKELQNKINRVTKRTLKTR